MPFSRTPNAKAADLVDLAIFTTDPSEHPPVYILEVDVDGQTKYVEAGHGGQVNYLTTDITKAVPMPRPIAEAMVGYLATACDCGNAGCGWPVGRTAKIILAPNARN
jgi:hypothetical protein